MAETAELLRPRIIVTRRSCRWHLVGRLQTNKARHVVACTQRCTRVDRAELAGALADAAARRRAGRRLSVFVQVSLDGDPRRGGVTATASPPWPRPSLNRPELRLRGVMAVAPMDADPAGAFAALAEASRSGCAPIIPTRRRSRPG